MINLQGIPVAWRGGYLLWCTVWEKHSLGNSISIWGYKGSSVCRKHFESSCMCILGALPVYSSVDPGLCFCDESGIKGRSSYSCPNPSNEWADFQTPTRHIQIINSWQIADINTFLCLVYVLLPWQAKDSTHDLLHVELKCDSKFPSWSSNSDL